MSLAETAINTFLDRKLAQPHHPAVRARDDERSLGKGIIAGVVAGLAAAAAKTLVEKVYPPTTRKNADPEPPHWAFGATAGAAYGALAEYYPIAASRDGVNFGMTLMALTHETGVSGSSLPPVLADQTTREKTSEIASHIVFGLVAETTRRFVRKML
jgi:putative membrane protein